MGNMNDIPFDAKRSCHHRHPSLPRAEPEGGLTLSPSRFYVLYGHSEMPGWTKFRKPMCITDISWR